MKKNIFTFCVIGVLLAAFFTAGFSITKSRAAALLPFGGRLVDWMYCTCSDSFWEFYVGAEPSPFPGGALAYVPYATILYANYNMWTPDVWHLGQYIPGVQSCWMYAGEGCFTLPVIGTEAQVGTSLTPSG